MKSAKKSGTAVQPAAVVPVTITLPPRLSAIVRLEALAANQSVERYVIESMAEWSHHVLHEFGWGDADCVRWITEEVRHA